MMIVSPIFQPTAGPGSFVNRDIVAVLSPLWRIHFCDSHIAVMHYRLPDISRARVFRVE